MSRRRAEVADILTFHRMYAAGATVLDISKETGCARNTITAHLSGEYAYEPQLAARVKQLMAYSSRPVPTSQPAPPGYITMKDAAELLPHRPAPRSVYKYAASGKLKSRLINGARYTKREWVAKLARTMQIPPGLISLSEAAELMPHKPSRKMVLGYISSRMMPGRMVQQGSLRLTYTTAAAVRAFILEHCLVQQTGLAVYRSDAGILLDDLPTREFWRQLDPGFPFAGRRAVMAYSVRGAADRSGLRFASKVPPVDWAEFTLLRGA